ncbi:MAG: EAL domain-containing protein [Betaproteobacteria bacterium]|nr:EAL domain-containing protein [Betaproteobacteria bacterium]
MIDGPRLSGASISPRALRWRLALGITLVNLFVISLAALALQQSRFQYQERAEINTRNLARVLEEEIGGDIEKIDVTLRTTSEEVARQLRNGSIEKRELNRLLQRQQALLPEILNLRVTDEHGMVAYGSEPVPAVTDVADREYFTRQQNASNDELVIASPTLAAIGQHWSIPLSRRIVRPDGSFAGVAYAELSIEHLVKTFATLDLGPHGVANLGDAQMRIMARYPEHLGMGSSIGKQALSPSLKKLIEAGEAAGTYRAHAVLDNIERTYSFRKVDEYPLYVAVGLAGDDYLEEWRVSLGKVAVWETLFFLATLLISRLIYRTLIRQQTAYEFLHNSEERFRYTLENSPIGMALVSLDGSFIEVNQALCQIVGYEKQELKGLTFQGITHPDDLTADLANVRALQEGKIASYQMEKRYVRKDGQDVWVQLTASIVRDAKGTPLHFVAQVENITERRRAAEQLSLSAKVFEESGECIVITDKDERIVSVNKAFIEVTGYSAAEVLGKTPRVMSSGQQDADFYKEMWRTLNSSGYWSGEIWDRRKSGDIYPKWVSISAVKDEQHQVTHYIGIFSDITERKKAEAQIEFLAYHDALTKLPNRLLARDHLEMAIAYAQRAGTKIALLFLDLDNFKTINDSFGHATGDALLIEVANRLRACTRETDTISRQGGDEFLVMLTNVADADAITRVTENILERLEETINIDAKELSTSLSIGIAVYPDDGKEIDTLLQLADTAMYHAKEAGRNTYRFYTEQMNVDAAAHQRIRVGLRRALERGEFVLHYQPQINLASGAVVGAEALIRWNHPELGLLPPGRFIQTAEESGLIAPMGDWVLQEACRQAAAWRAVGLPELVVAVNISALQLQRGDLEQSVLGALAASGLPPAFLELELTESILIQDTEKVLETVHRLKSHGLMLSIDDFGTGYSSLAYLKRFNVDKLKIDRSFVCDMMHNPNDAVIVRAIIQMARNLNLRTIAEGVEDEHLLAFLRLQYCDEAQGFYFSRPLPADEFAQYLVKNAQAALGSTVP